MKFHLLLCAVLSWNVLYSQSITKYYFPTNNANTSNLYTPDPQTGRKTGGEELIHFVKVSSVVAREIRVQLFSGRIGSASELELKLSEDKIVATKKTSFSTFDSQPKTINFNPPQTILVMPKEKSVSWNYKEGTTITKCIAVFDSVYVQDVKKKAIKVSKTVTENGKLISWAATTEYYAENVGLCKIVVTSTNEIFGLLDKQFFEKNIPTIK